MGNTDIKYEIGHIAFVVKDLDTAMAFMKALGAELSEKKNFGNQKNVMEGSEAPWQVTYCTGKLGNMGLEIFMPEGDGTPYSDFMKKTGGGIHHISFDNLGELIVPMRDDLVEKGAVQFSSAESRKHGMMACYLNVPAMSGTVIELKK